MRSFLLVALTSLAQASDTDPLAELPIQDILVCRDEAAEDGPIIELGMGGTMIMIGDRTWGPYPMIEPSAVHLSPDEGHFAFAYSGSAEKKHWILVIDGTPHRIIVVDRVVIRHFSADSSALYVWEMWNGKPRLADFSVPASTVLR